ncbi:MAG: DNA polymerase III subunit delta [Methylococcaceae bacterium]
MKLNSDKLPAHLKQKLAPVYLLSGDEPLQMTEALDAIRQTAKAQGFVGHELFYADGHFDWGAFEEASQSSALFGEARVLDLRLPSKPDKQAAAVLQAYAERPPDDAILIISLMKMTAADQKVRWFQALDKIGVFIPFWPIEGDALIRWLDHRMSQRGLLAEHSGIGILARRVEGNLLAAAQEVEKLHILYGSGRVTDQHIMKAVADSARYDVFDLSDALLLGQADRVVRILSGLKAEGIAQAVVLWSITRELRMLNGIHLMLAEGVSTETVFSRYQIWDKRKPAVNTALRRVKRQDIQNALLKCAWIDRASKGMETGEPWDALLEVCLNLAAKP